MAEGRRQQNDQSPRPNQRIVTPDVDRAIQELRKKVQSLQESSGILYGDRGAAGLPLAAVRRQDMSAMVKIPLVNPSSVPTSGPADATYGTLERDMLNELKAATLELQETMALVLDVLRAFERIGA